MLKKTLALLITCVLVILLFSRVPLVISPRLINTLWPIGHVVCFAFWTWLLISCSAYIQGSNSKKQLVILSLITLIIGGGIELIQPFFARSAQLGDLFYNLFGTFAAFLFFGNVKTTNKRLLAARIIYTLIFLYLMFPAMQSVKDEYETRMDFPIIAKFDSSSELTRWKADQPLSIVNTNELASTAVTDVNLMKVTFAAAKHSHVALRFFSGNWQGFKKIKFSFYNPNQNTLKVRLIATDKKYNKSKPNYKDRFGKWLMIDPGWHDYSVDLAQIRDAPTKRMMDLSDMAGVDLYIYKLTNPIHLYVHKLELTSD